MKFPRKCIECGRLATSRVLFYGKNRPFCDRCAKNIRRKGGEVPKAHQFNKNRIDTIRKPNEDFDDLSFYINPDLNSKTDEIRK